MTHRKETDMAISRKDPKGRALHKGETYRKTDGRYVYNYTDPYGKNRSIYAPDLLTLREKEKNLIKDQLDGLDVYLQGKATLNYVFDRYIKTKVDLRSTTKSSYTYNYDHYIRDNFGKRKIADIKYSDVMNYYLYLINEEEISLNTVDNLHTLIHPTFNLAVRDNIIRNNPSDKVLGELSKKIGKGSGIRHALKPEEQKTFMEYVKNDPLSRRWWPLFMTMLGTGGRVGEIIGLRWCDCDFENRIISINHSISYNAVEEDGERRSRYILSKPKTEKGIRFIPMMDEVYEALMLEREIQSVTGFNETKIDGMSGFIFQNRIGKVHKPSSINKAIERIRIDCNGNEELKARKENRKAVEVPHFSCHIFRHTFCTRLCEVETDLKVIQDIMGHKDIQTTFGIYAEASENKKKEAIADMSKKLSF